MLTPEQRDGAELAQDVFEAFMSIEFDGFEAAVSGLDGVEHKVVFSPEQSRELWKCFCRGAIEMIERGKAEVEKPKPHLKLIK